MYILSSILSTALLVHGRNWHLLSLCGAINHSSTSCQFSLSFWNLDYVWNSSWEDPFSWITVPMKARKYFPKQERTDMQPCLWHSVRQAVLIAVAHLEHVFHILSHLCCASTRDAPFTVGSSVGTVGFIPLSPTMPIWNSWKLELGWIKVVTIFSLIASSLGHEPPSEGSYEGEVQLMGPPGTTTV